MPETAALLLDWVKDKQPEDYLFPAGRASAVPHITRVRFFQLFGDYCRQAGIPAHLSVYAVHNNIFTAMTPGHRWRFRRR